MSEFLFTSKSVILNANVDAGMPELEHFQIRSEDIDISIIEDGDIVVETKFISADPYLRGQIKSTGMLKAGNVMSGFISGKIISSKNSNWSVGDLIGGVFPFSTLQIVRSAFLSRTMTWKLNDYLDESELSFGIGVLGMPGATAYGGLVDVLRPNKGETIFISAASGAVGSLVGMIAKSVYGCKVIGSCGGPDKCALVKEKFGFDYAIDYKTITNAAELIIALKAVAPEGIDMYFENVGGMHFEAAMDCLRKGGRIAVCGQIAEYNSAKPELCAFNPMKMIYTSQRIEGFVSFTWLSDKTKQAAFLNSMHQWLREGKLQAQETAFQGIEQWPVAFRALFTGANLGKVVVVV